MALLKNGIVWIVMGVLAMAAPATQGQSAQVSIDGLWGGDRLQLRIDAGQGRVEMDCASGRLTGPLTWSEGGRFVASGTFGPLRAGAQPADAAAPAAAARYSGELSDGVLRLEILPEGAPAPMVFMLRQGVRVKLIRCL